ncbi:FHA domain-containing protein [Streptomyces sp. NPDC014656]|uniref:FHA domain-containing protein n=1 Tax=Streptomyces sp. NPDC014656 TaxID=3364878 RepID=UPI0036F6892C
MDPGRQLALDAGGADFLVDTANVVRATELTDGRPAHLERLTLLCEALAGFARDESAQVYAVVDRTLLSDPHLSPAERATLARWAAEGRVEVLPWADPRLLELAHALDMPVVSRDNYVDFHRRYPWIPGNTDTFLLPVPDAGGRGVAVVPRIMPVVEEARISLKEEQNELHAVGLHDRRGSGVRERVFRRSWHCPEPGCRLFGPDARAAAPMPGYRQGVPRCPEHAAPLADAGPAPARVLAKIRVDGVLRTRFTVVEGDLVTVGRFPDGPGRIALFPWLEEGVRRLISRDHLRVTVRGGALRVSDTSHNGSTVRRRDAPPVPLRPGREWTLRPGQVVELYEGVELLLSGRRYTLAPDDGERDPHPPPRPEDSAPTMLRPPDPAGGASGGIRGPGPGGGRKPGRRRRRR